MLRHAVRFHLLIGLVLAPGGCNAEAKLYPVHGTVVFDNGAPATALAGGTVSLESTSDLSNYAGTIQADGTYRIETPLGKLGAPAGAYRVLVMPPEPTNPDQPPPEIIARRFRSYETSQIQVIVEERPNDFPIRVSRN